MNKAVEYTIDTNTGIGTITLCRPKVLNAIDIQTGQEMSEAMQAMVAHKNLRVVLIRSEGRAFLAGGDLSSFHADYNSASLVLDKILDGTDNFLKLAATLDIPIVASVQGAAAGAGLSIVAACDIVISANDARYVLAYNDIGAIPDCGGTWNLLRKLGEKQLSAMMFTSETLDAQSAKNLGLVTKIVDSNELQSETDKIVHKIASGPTFAYRQYKQLIKQSSSNTLQEQLDAERKAFKQCIQQSEDFKIGVTAFLNRQKPTFTGQ